MTPRLQPGSTWQATNQSNSQEPNNKQSSSGITTEGLQLDSQQHNNTSVPEEQNIDELLKTI